METQKIGAKGQRGQEKVRPILPDEIPGLFDMADMFFSESSFLVGFDRDVFVRSWTGFLDGGNGIIFVVEVAGIFVGALGALKFQDPNNGNLIASELFWYVRPEHRGKGLDLLAAFENWADDAGCQQKTMVYLTDSMPDQVKRIYERKGYRAMEIHYTKEN